MEQIVARDLEPAINASSLQDLTTFDAVLRRSRSALLTAANQGEQGDAIFLAAVQVLERNAALRTLSRSVRNALYQG